MVLSCCLSLSLCTQVMSLVQAHLDTLLQSCTMKGLFLRPARMSSASECSSLKCSPPPSPSPRSASMQTKLRSALFMVLDRGFLLEPSRMIKSLFRSCRSAGMQVLLTALHLLTSSLTCKLLLELTAALLKRHACFILFPCSLLSSFI